MKISPLRLIAILLLVSTCLAKSDHSAAASSSVHVQGMVNGVFGYDVCPGTEITFTSEHISKLATSERNGSYKLDLPAGLYTMTARYQILIGKTPHYVKQTRPLFRASSSPVVLNVRMFAERLTCDMVSMGNETSEQRQEAIKNACGYEDQFTVPASDGTPYQLFIKYPKRSPKSRVYEYSGDRLETDTFTPVLVEYNLFTLTAEHVIYDLDSKTISASGNVEVVNQLGKTQNAASMTFKINNGEAIPVR